MWLAVTAILTFAAACVQLSSEDLATPPLRAFGNEPFWDVTFFWGDSVVYTRLGEERRLFPAVLPDAAVIDSTGFAYGPVRDASGRNEIEVRIFAESCQDTMADLVHPMRSTVILDEQEHSGCARWVGDAPPAERS